LIDDEGINLAKSHGTALVFDIYNDDYIPRREPGRHAPDRSKRKSRSSRPAQNFAAPYQAAIG